MQARRSIMEIFEAFHHCPRCGKAIQPPGPSRPVHCAACGLSLYLNPAIAVAVIVRGPDERVLFLRRSKDPARGKLALPGGFVDFGETAEEAARRETREEVNLELGGLEFLCSAPNRYVYGGINYAVLDFFFVSRAADADAARALDGAESLCWVDTATMDLEEIAFTSIREAIRRFNTGRR
jgi:ADP-ribose pyrophosphatase YjhB (NUDIX family)